MTSCSVSLLTNSMGVEGTASSAAIIQAVQEAGYGATPQDRPVLPPASLPQPPTWTRWPTTRPPKLKRRLIASRGSFCWY